MLSISLKNVEDAKIAEDILHILFKILTYLTVAFLCCVICLTFLFYRISLSLVHFLRERQDKFLSCLINVLHLDENKQVASFELCSIVIKFMYSLWPSFLGSNGNEWRNPLAKVLRQTH